MSDPEGPENESPLIARHHRRPWTQDLTIGTIDSRTPGIRESIAQVAVQRSI